MEFDVKVPENSWFALVYGTGMSKTDAVVFRGTKSGDKIGVVNDVWLNGYSGSGVETDA